MPMFHNLLLMMGQSSDIDADLSKVYAYASTFGISRSQVDAKITEKPFLRSRLIAWKYLIHSLFDTGCTPWLKGDGVAYFIVPMKPNVNSYAEAVTRAAETNASLLLGARIDISYSNQKTRHALVFASSGIRLDWTLHNLDVYHVNTLSKHKIKVTTGYLAIDDVVVINRNDIITELPDVEFAVFTCNNANGDATSFRYNGYFNRVVITGDIAPNLNGSVNLVPYSNNGEYGMLDLVSGDFYGSAVANGRFSYKLWDENNNVVNIV